MIDMEEYLGSTEVIDYGDPGVSAKAKELAEGIDNKLLIAKRSFEWVRDRIRRQINVIHIRIDIEIITIRHKKGI